MKWRLLDEPGWGGYVMIESGGETLTLSLDLLLSAFQSQVFDNGSVLSRAELEVLDSARSIIDTFSQTRADNTARRPLT